jgi:hypothetical protein
MMSLALLWLAGSLVLAGCGPRPPRTVTPPPGPTGEPTAPNSPIPSPTPPVSPLATPQSQAQPTLAPEFTGPLSDYTINGDIRAEFIPIQFYDAFVWTGITWDGVDYVWIANNELKVISGFNVKTAANDRMVSFPIDVEPAPVLGGLTWDGSHFWISDVTNGMIYQIDAITGNRVTEFAYDGVANGLVWADGGLWALSRENMAIERLTPAGEVEESKSIPGTWPTGLAWDGRYFWYTDAHTGTLSIFNPATGKSTVLDELQFMVNQATFNGLAWMNGYLWVVTEGHERLHRVDVSQLDWQAIEAAIQ